MDVVALQAAKADAARKYARKLPPGSRLVKNRVGAAVMSTAPTFTSSTAATLAKTIGPYDTRMRISGAGQYQYTLNGGYGQGPVKTDGSLSPYAGSWFRSFDFDGQAFEFRTTPQTDSRFRVWVNEQPHAATPVQLSTVAGTVVGTGTWVKVDFGSRAQRRVMVEMVGNSPTNWNNMNVATIDSVLPPSIPSLRIAWVGDSISYGLGGSSLHTAYPVETAWLLGIDDVFTSDAIPSTGLLKTNAPYGTYASRFAVDIQPLAPDVLVIQASINDATVSYNGVVGPALTSYVQTARAALPNCTIIVVSPLCARTPSADELLVRDQVKTAATALGLPFIDAFASAYSVFFGTGQVGNTKGDGNADIYCEAAAARTHPNDAGADYLARWMAGQIGRVIGQPV